MLGQFEVGGSKCALRDHSEVPGVTGAGLSLGALAGSKVGERVVGHLDSLPPQGSTGVVTTHDGWAQVRPYSSPLPRFRLVPIWPFLSFFFFVCFRLQH